MLQSAILRIAALTATILSSSQFTHALPSVSSIHHEQDGSPPVAGTIDHRSPLAARSSNTSSGLSLPLVPPTNSSNSSDLALPEAGNIFIGIQYSGLNPAHQINSGDFSSLMSNALEYCDLRIAAQGLDSPLRDGRFVAKDATRQLQISIKQLQLEPLMTMFMLRLALLQIRRDMTAHGSVGYASTGNLQISWVHPGDPTHYTNLARGSILYLNAASR